MKGVVAATLLCSCILAAIGQVLLRKGAVGRDRFVDFINPMLIGGLGLFAIATVLWVYGLSKAPLHIVYPFTMLTFVLVGLSSVLFLGERVPFATVVGWAVICLGIGLVYLGSTTQ